MLTDIQCRTAKPREKPYKLSDGGGLYLEVLPTGTKSWRMAYRHNGRQKRLVIGLYPEVSLSAARDARRQAREELANNLDPSLQKKLKKISRENAAANTFEAVAREFIDKCAREGFASATLKKKRWLLLDLAAPLAKRSIAEITAPELLSVLREAEQRGAFDTAKRLRIACGQVFRYAVATQRAERDPTADLRGALTAPSVTHRATITEPKEIGALWRAIGDYTGQPETKLALQFAILTAARPGEVRTAEWNEIDMTAREWRIPPEKIKMRRTREKKRMLSAHRVPLSDQACAVLESLRQLTGSGRYLFPSVRSWQSPMSEGTLVAALRRMGYLKSEICAHGFRSMFSTYSNESGVWDPDVIEAALDHLDSNEVRRAYNRAEHWRARVELLHWWGNEIDRLAFGGESNVVLLERGLKA